MDYLLADETGVPEHHRAHFSETVWYLPDTRLCFTPPHTDLPVSPLPGLGSGSITLGCYQNLSKINEAVLAVWGRIFAALPRARLRLACKQLGDATVAAQLRQRLRQYGIAETRVALYGSVDRETYLASHAEVDLLLDTFPYPGGTTTCEALWMGVPTLTLAGETLLSRQGASLLTAASLPDWIARDEDDYVAKAIAFTGDLPKLAALRAGLREQVRVSPLFDAPRFAKNFEAALWGMWQAKLPALSGRLQASSSAHQEHPV
jgi:predicted O-linked N-acetylglucosamine transferase (SPINDLY family)